MLPTHINHITRYSYYNVNIVLVVECISARLWMRNHSWDIRMYICTFVSVMLGMSICAHAQGLRHHWYVHYTRMSMEDRVGERGAVNIHSSGFWGTCLAECTNPQHRQKWCTWMNISSINGGWTDIKHIYISRMKQHEPEGWMVFRLTYLLDVTPSNHCHTPL